MDTQCSHHRQQSIMISYLFSLLFIKINYSFLNGVFFLLNILFTYNDLLLQVISDIFNPVIVYQIAYILHLVIHLF